MPKKQAQSVTYHAEDGPRFALVTDGDGDNLDLVVVDKNGAWGEFKNVPHGKPGDGGSWS